MRNGTGGKIQPCLFGLQILLKLYFVLIVFISFIRMTPPMYVEHARSTIGASNLHKG